jgi:hypothetical protein
MSKVKGEDTTKKNIKAKRDFRLKSKPIIKGQVVSKSDFPNKSDWQNLCNMTPPRAEETNAAVGKPKAEKAAIADAKTGGMPGT